MKSIITPLLEISQQLHVFHWQTKSYAEHEAFGKTYETLEQLIDMYVETFFGRLDRIYASEQFTVSLVNYNEDNVQEYLKNSLDYLENDLPVEINDALALDLSNIRDEMIQAITKLKYLLTLK